MRLVALLPDPVTDRSRLVRGVPRRVDENRREARVIVGLAVQQQERGLPGDHDARFLGELEATAAFELLFHEQHARVAEQLALPYACRNSVPLSARLIA